MRRYLSLLLIGALVLLAFGAPAAQGGQGKAAAKVGQAVLVQWGTSWWRASVLAELRNERVVVHYAGWSDDHDEIVGLDRVAFEAPVPARLRRGDAVLVEWNGSFWPAEVRYVEGAKTAIRYDGYGSEWDEAVPRSRLLRMRR
jgi:hypothetical protein